MVNKLIKITIFLTLLYSAASCSDTGIFHSLENEVLVQENNNLENSTVFSNMVKIGNYYYGNAGINIYYRHVNPDNPSTDTNEAAWSKLVLPNGKDNTPAEVNEVFAGDAAVTSMIEIGPDGSESLFISRVSRDGASIVSGIYHLPFAAASAPGTVKSTSWSNQVKTVVPKSGIHFSNIYRLFKAGSDLYVNHIKYQYTSEVDTTASLSTSQLFFSVNPVTNNIGNNLTDSHANITEIIISTFVQDDSDPPKDIIATVEKVIYDGTTNYWLIMNGKSQGKLYNSTDGSTYASVAGNPQDVRYVDIYSVDATRLLLSDTAGALHILDKGDGTFRKLTNSNAWLTGFYNISGLGTITDRIVIGTAGNKGESTYSGEGYVQLNISGDDSTWDWVETNFSDKNNYLSSDLSDASINGFLFDDLANPERLFAYTAGHGVWVNEYISDKRIWALE